MQNLLKRQIDEFEKEPQIYALHTILHALHTQGLLSDNPASVCIEREGMSPVYPCGRGYDEYYERASLDFNQIDWAFEHNQFWFNGPIKTLWIELDTKNPIVDVGRAKWLVTNMAKNRGLKIKFEKYIGPNADLR